MVIKSSMEGEPHPVIAAALPDDQWAELQKMVIQARRRGRDLLRCVDCRHPMYARQAASGTRHFVHTPHGNGACGLTISGGEGAEHDRLKTVIYKAIKKVRGFDADVEHETSTVDPVTGRPGRVDVVAIPADRTDGLRGWEVQLSSMTEGQVLTRQESREAYLERCTWVTQSRPRWAHQVPWYRIGHPLLPGDLVTDGVNREVELGDGQGIVYEPLDPFPSDQMVRYILRRRVIWTDVEGWVLDPGRTRIRRHRRQRKSQRGRAAEWCSREEALPEYVARWGDGDWALWARGAHARGEAGEDLSALDEAAIARFPLPDFFEDETFPRMPFDRLVDQRPCVSCGQLTVVSARADEPIHHHCAMHLARGDACTVPGFVIPR
jgi:hypothetical protein